MIIDYLFNRSYGLAYVCSITIVSADFINLFVKHFSFFFIVHQKSFIFIEWNTVDTHFIIIILDCRFLAF